MSAPPTRPNPKPNPETGPNDQTLPAQQSVPRGKLPHERDESADTAMPMPDQDIADKAHADAQSERVDTDCALSGRTDCPRNPAGT